MQNRKILSVVILIVAGLLILPYFMGNVAYNTIHKQAEQISSIPGYNLVVKEYDQSWFTSKVELNYGFDEHTLKIMGKSSENDQKLFDLIKNGMTIKFDVAHGPITFQNGINFALITASGLLQDVHHEEYHELLNELKITTPFKIFSTISFNRTISTNIKVSSFEYDGHASDGEKIQTYFDGMNITIKIDSELNEYNLKLNTPKLSIITERGEFSIYEIDAQSSGDRLNQYLWLGEGEFNIGQIRLTDKTANHDVTFDKIINKYSLYTEGGPFLTFKWMSNMQKVHEHNITVENITIDTQITQLDIEGVTEYVKAIQDSYQKFGNKAEDAIHNSMMMEIEIRKAGEKILQNSPKLTIRKLEFAMGEGQFTGDATMAIDGSDLPSIAILSDKRELNKRLSAVSDIKFNKQLANEFMTITMKRQMAAMGQDINAVPEAQLKQMANLQVTTALQTFVTQGFLVRKDDEYSSHFEMIKGQPYINGKQQALPRF